MAYRAIPIYCFPWGAWSINGVACKRMCGPAADQQEDSGRI